MRSGNESLTKVFIRAANGLINRLFMNAANHLIYRNEVKLFVLSPIQNSTARQNDERKQNDKTNDLLSYKSEKREDF